MPRKITRPVIARAEAPGLYAIAHGVKAALAEHVLIVAWAAQAHLLIPGWCGPDVRLNGQRERRVLKLSTALAEAALAFYRMPTITCDSLILSRTGRGAQRPQNPFTRALLDEAIASPEAAAPPPEPLTSLEIEDRLFRLRMEPSRRPHEALDHR